MKAIHRKRIAHIHHVGRRRVVPYLILALLTVLVVLIGNAAFKMYDKVTHSRERAMQTKESLEKLYEHEVFIKHEIERLQTEQGLSSELRSKFGVAKPGEKMIVIIDDEKSQETTVEEPSLFKKIGMWFSGWF